MPTDTNNAGRTDVAWARAIWLFQSDRLVGWSPLRCGDRRLKARV